MAMSNANKNKSASGWNNNKSAFCSDIKKATNGAISCLQKTLQMQQASMHTQPKAVGVAYPVHPRPHVIAA